MKEQPRGATRHRSGPRRDEAARRAVLHAADGLLVEHGFGGLTIEAIAREAGVAKQTIYRWWPSKVEILLEALLEGMEKQLEVPGGDHPSTEAVVGYFRRLAQFVVGTEDGQVLLALISQSQLDTSVQALLRGQLLAPRRALERDLLQRARVDRAPARELDAALDEFIGPIVYRRLLGLDVDDSYVAHLLTTVITPQLGPRRQSAP